MKTHSQVRLSKHDQQELRRLLQSGLQPVRTVLRALALQQLAEGQTVRQVAKNVALTPKTVWLTSQRYRQGGLERALYERPRPGKAALLNAQDRQRIVALVCSPPPEGRARWTVRLLTEEVVKRKLVLACRARDHPRPAGKPRPEAVAGKTCGAWRNWMRSISGAWRTSWRCMRSR